MAMSLPSFSALAANYPVEDADAVKEEIGGRVDADWITNTCVVRVSKALNYAGDEYEIPKVPGLLTVTGADRKNYALRVKEFVAFLRTTYGNPDVVRSGRNIAIDPFLGETGIIVWHVRGWSDATGHFTLWDGNEGLYEGEHRYFDMPNAKPAGGGPWLTKVELWRC